MNEIKLLNLAGEDASKAKFRSLKANLILETNEYSTKHGAFEFQIFLLTQQQKLWTSKFEVQTLNSSYQRYSSLTEGSVITGKSKSIGLHTVERQNFGIKDPDEEVGRISSSRTSEGEATGQNKRAVTFVSCWPSIGLQWRPIKLATSNGFLEKFSLEPEMSDC